MKLQSGRKKKWISLIEREEKEQDQILMIMVIHQELSMVGIFLRMMIKRYFH